MRRIDKYIFFKYLSTFAFTVLVMTLIACVIDFSEKVEDFIDNSATTREILLEYYLTFIPHINGLIFPLYALISVIFFTSRMAFNSEVISILGAGISFQRMLVPYVAAASVIFGIHMLANHLIIPYGNKTRLKFENKYTDRGSNSARTDNIHLFLDPYTKVFIRHYNRIDTSMTGLRIEKIVNGELLYLLKSEKTKWLGPPNRWRFEKYETHTFRGLSESFTKISTTTLDTTLSLTPQDFIRYTNQKDMITTPELLQTIQREKSRGTGNTKIYDIEFHRRTADAFTILILTIIGVSVAARKVRGGMGLHLAVGVGIGALFIFLSKFSVTFATGPNMPAMLGVWIPNMIFMGVAGYLIAKAQK